MLDKNAKILIADDYQTMRGLIRNLFNLLGFDKTDEAGTTDEALEKLVADDYGLVIFDWTTGPLSGEDFFKKVQADERLKKVPFIVISAKSDPELTEKMRAAGAADFIAKPFNKATLEKRLKSLFGE